MGMGMSATKTEMKAQNVKSGIGFQIVQNEKQLFLVRIKITFRAALFDVFYLALFDTLSIDGESGRLEYFDEGCELRLGHSNQRCHDAVIGYLAKFVVDHGRFLYSDLFEKQVGYQYHALASGTTLIEEPYPLARVAETPYLVRLETLFGIGWVADGWQFLGLILD